MTPSERAFPELSDLIGRGLPEKGLFKDFYIELTHVVRRYIERSHGIRAPEQTTEEFLAAAKSHPRFTPEVIAKLADFLRSADLVKFAGVGSSASVADEAVRTARAYIEHDTAATSTDSKKPQ
jgi:DNA-binding MurR/RpiR family transcriptional regulator